VRGSCSGRRHRRYGHSSPSPGWSCLGSTGNQQGSAGVGLAVSSGHPPCWNMGGTAAPGPGPVRFNVKGNSRYCVGNSGQMDTNPRSVLHWPGTLGSHLSHPESFTASIKRAKPLSHKGMRIRTSQCTESVPKNGSWCCSLGTFPKHLPWEVF
jgi:hypothetical protein